MKTKAVHWGLWTITVTLTPVVAAPQPANKPVSKSVSKPIPKPYATTKPMAPPPSPQSALPGIAPVIQELLTPVPDKPQIWGPTQTGISPRHPFLYRIPATGKEPLVYTTTNLPQGLKLKGPVISGSIDKAGSYPVLLTVSGPGGKSQRQLTIVCGADKLALTPPLGWNTWNVFGEDVTATQVAQQADLLITKGLAARGWQYIIVDDSWQARRGDDGLIRPRPRFLSKRFPDMRALADFLHERGLKLGLMTSPNKLTPLGHAGSAGFEESDAAQYAKWGVDYVKCDWRADDEGVPDVPKTSDADTAAPSAGLTPEAQRAQEDQRRQVEAQKRLADEQRLRENMRSAYTKLRAALDKTDRDIVFNVVTYGFGGPNFEWVKSTGAQSWTGRPSMVDNWNSLHSNGDSLNQFADGSGSGFWTDPGPLMLGRFIPRNPRFTRFTLDEQKTQMTLWSMASAPLILSCNLSQLDPNGLYPITTALLTNPEILAINQDLPSHAAHKVILPPRQGERRDIFDYWARPLSDGTLVVGIFNWRPATERASFLWSDFGLSSSQPVRDVWLRKDLGTIENGFSSIIPGHGVVLLKVGTPRPM